MSKKQGEAIRKARLGADMTQEQLARRVAGVSANDISLAERGEKTLTQEQLKKIAKVTGVTQTSILNAGKKNSSGSSGSSSSSKWELTAGEQALVRAYRKADTETRKEAMAVLKGTDGGILGDIIEAAAESLFKKK